MKQIKTGAMATLDRDKLLGFRGMVAFGVDAAALRAELTAKHVKVGAELPPPSPFAASFAANETEEGDGKTRG